MSSQTIGPLTRAGFWAQRSGRSWRSRIRVEVAVRLAAPSPARKPGNRPIAQRMIPKSCRLFGQDHAQKLRPRHVLVHLAERALHHRQVLGGNPRDRLVLQLPRHRDQPVDQRPRPWASARPSPRGCCCLERLRVTSPMRTSRVTSRDRVETSMLVMLGEIDLALPAVVRQRRQHPPHGDAEIVRGERVRGKARDQRGADAVDQVGKVVRRDRDASVGHGDGPWAGLRASD